MTHRAGNAHFEDTWDALLVGFNNDSVGEYYIGNHALKYLIGKGDFILRLDMWSADGGYITAEYSGLSMISKLGLTATPNRFTYARLPGLDVATEASIANEQSSLKIFSNQLQSSVFNRIRPWFRIASYAQN